MDKGAQQASSSHGLSGEGHKIIANKNLYKQPLCHILHVHDKCFHRKVTKPNAPSFPARAIVVH